MTALDLQPHAQALGFDAVEVLHDASEVREVRLLLSRLTMLSLSLLFFSRRGPQASHRCALMSYLTTDHHMSYSCDIDPVTSSHARQAYHAAMGFFQGENHSNHPHGVLT